MRDDGEEKKKFEAFFGSASSLKEPRPAYSVYITPSTDKFDDFGHMSRVKVAIRGEGGEEDLVMEARLGFLDGAPSKHKTLEAILAEARGLVVPATAETHRFFTMLPDMESYRQAVQQFGPERARAALVAANDLVALKEALPSSNLPQLAERTSVFTMSFMRMSDTYFAYQRAGSILRGLTHEQLGAISGDMRLRFKLSGRPNHHDMTFRFDPHHELPKRIAVVIGKNGVGKSQTLARVARAALHRSPSLVGLVDKEPVVVSRVLAFAPTADAASLFPSPKSAKHRVSYFRLEIGAARRSGAGAAATRAINDLLRMERRVKGVPRWDIFLEALDALTDGHQISLAKTAPRAGYTPLSELYVSAEMRQLERLAAVDWKKDPVRVINGTAHRLSSGELSFIKFAAQASAFVENGSLLLLDEPETHLHPNFISRFMSLLDSLLEQTGSVAIIATHSVYFVREVFREQVTVLRLDGEGNVFAERPRLRTFGGDVGAISFFVFGEDGPSRFGTELTEKLAMSNRPWQAIEKQYGDELSPEFLMQLRRRMESAKDE